MSVKLTHVIGDDVYIERLDGLSNKVGISLFNKENQ